MRSEVVSFFTPPFSPTSPPGNGAPFYVSVIRSCLFAEHSPITYVCSQDHVLWEFFFSTNSL